MSDHDEVDLSQKHLFMMCEQMNSEAAGTLPEAYHVRCCRREELDVWMRMPFDDPRDAEKALAFMSDYFSRVYGNKKDLFFETCLFVCDKRDNPIGTAFIWKVYEEITTLHWLKVRKEYEGRGIGRALLSIDLKRLHSQDYPVYLHTHPSSFRAIKLYADFGFKLLSDPVIGCRLNGLHESLPFLQKHMIKDAFDSLQIVEAPGSFLKKLEKETEECF